MRRLAAMAAAVVDFVVGNDWRLALGVAAALGLTAVLVATGVNAWWAAPLVVAGVLVWSLRDGFRPDG
jgi:hypothetical protein